MRKNEAMVEYASPDGAVIAVWDGASRGTRHTIELARRLGLKVFVLRVAGS